ncbi:Ureidoglycolate lyase [Trapelia coarctata]|nr:Ureidoglycolate lyase [Trapelia coarctata]
MAPKNLPVSPQSISLSPLTRSSFAPFGYVIENPTTPSSPSLHPPTCPIPTPLSANQGTALKYPNISHLHSTYHLSSSPETAKPILSLFVCSPRQLRRVAANSNDQGAVVGGGNESGGVGFLPIGVLERHPYTTQTFSPLGLSPFSSTSSSASPDPPTVYIVVVAPNIPSGPSEGMPDVPNMKAFLAKGAQAVTYGVGVWHAPMMVVGSRDVPFLVVQVANGVGEDDCEDVELVGEGKGEEDAGIGVLVPELRGGLGDGKGVKSRL